MTKLKLGAIPEDKPVKVSHEIPAPVFEDLTLYARLMAESGQPPVEPVKLIVPMIARFMATDRAFAKARRSLQSSKTGV
ncbi:DUF2274 domain-containing protein [Mesorhizobium sp.]|uniref:DUF2274 domain-containing protein n=1 Tax=Mesorhizobium sp. TaxID=1871066 RepID=UPI0025F4B2B3|nr:DUF2274 domain-containing protein [Mesorhizobium sp.]